MLVEAQRGMRRDAVMRGKVAGGAQHQIVVAQPSERRRFGPGHL